MAAARRAPDAKSTRPSRPSTTLPATSSSPHTALSCHSTSTPAARTRFGVGGIRAPSRRISPASSSTTPPMHATSDDLPAPVSPTRATISPSCTRTETSRSTSAAPKRFVTPTTSSSGADPRAVSPVRLDRNTLPPGRGPCGPEPDAKPSIRRWQRAPGARRPSGGLRTGQSTWTIVSWRQSIVLASRCRRARGR